MDVVVGFQAERQDGPAMNKADVENEVQSYIRCPHCQGGRTMVSHLFNGYYPRPFGPWYCDACGGSYCGEVRERNEVFIQIREERRGSILALLQYEDMLLIVKTPLFSDHGLDCFQFFFESHQCPTNFLRDAVEVIDLKSMRADPHGLFKYLGCLSGVDPEAISLDEVEAVLERVRQGKPKQLEASNDRG